MSDVLPFGRLWYGEPNAVENAIGYVKHLSRSHDAVIRVYDDTGNLIETHEHKGEFEEWRVLPGQLGRFRIGPKEALPSHASGTTFEAGQKLYWAEGRTTFQSRESRSETCI